MEKPVDEESGSTMVVKESLHIRKQDAKKVQSVDDVEGRKAG